jgi:hypothetical protein
VHRLRAIRLAHAREVSSAHGTALTATVTYCTPREILPSQPTVTRWPGHCSTSDTSSARRSRVSETATGAAREPDYYLGTLPSLYCCRAARRSNSAERSYLGTLLVYDSTVLVLPPSYFTENLGPDACAAKNRSRLPTFPVSSSTSCHHRLRACERGTLTSPSISPACH